MVSSGSGGLGAKARASVALDEAAAVNETQDAELEAAMLARRSAREIRLQRLRDSCEDLSARVSGLPAGPVGAKEAIASVGPRKRGSAQLRRSSDVA